MNESKKPYQSKTIIVNAIMGLIAVAAMFIPQANNMATYMNNHASEIAMGWSILNIILRTITKDKVTLSE